MQDLSPQLFSTRNHLSRRLLPSLSLSDIVRTSSTEGKVGCEVRWTMVTGRWRLRTKEESMRDGQRGGRVWHVHVPTDYQTHHRRST